MAHADPYRAPQPPEGSAPAATLTLRPRTAETQGLGTRPVLGVIAITIVMFVVLYYLAMVVEVGTLVVSVLVMLVAIVVGQVVRVSRSRRVAFSLQGGYVTIRVGAEAPRVIVASDVRDITLDHAPEPGFAVVGHGVRAAGVASPTGRARVLIRLADGAEIRLPSMPIAHTEIVEWLGDVRRFMRTAGFAQEGDPMLDDETPIAALDQARDAGDG